MDVLKIFALLLLLSVTSDAVKRYGCYSSPGSPCTSVTLGCFGSSVISLDHAIELGKSDDICQREDQCLSDLCCIPQNNVIPTLADFQYHLSVFTSCSCQQSCNVTVPYNQSLTYDYISYPYTCLKDERNFDASSKVDKNVPKQVYLYVNGKNNPPSNLARSCKVQTENQFKSVKARYINLRSESCNKIRISQNETLFNCTEEQLVILNEELDITGNQIDITIHSLTLQTDEFISLEFVVDDDANISLKCEVMDQATISTPSVVVISTSVEVTHQATVLTPPLEVTSTTVDVTYRESKTNIAAIVGGILGTALFISICVIILLIIYFKRIIKKRESHQVVNQNNHDYTTTLNRVGDTATVVYDSLNTRQQTGYYNMGNINQYDDSRPDTAVDSLQQTTATGDSPQQTNTTNEMNYSNLLNKI